MNEQWERLLAWQAAGEERTFILRSTFRSYHVYTCSLEWVSGEGEEKKLHGVSREAEYMEIAIDRALHLAERFVT